MRSMTSCLSADTTYLQRRLATALRRVLAARRGAQDLLDVGAYAPGSNPLVDAAVAHADQIDRFLCQAMEEQTPAGDSWALLGALVARLGVS